jgi:Fe-S cluster assembly iron-binding protein IscA
MLELSDDAVREIKDIAQGGGLRFVAQEDDDGSTSFDPTIEDGPKEGDVVVERDGAKVFLDALAAEKLADLMLDIEAHGDHVHFDFVRQGGEDEDDEPDGDDPAAA